MSIDGWRVEGRVAERDMARMFGTKRTNRLLARSPSLFGFTLLLCCSVLAPGHLLLNRMYQQCGTGENIA